jgi:hypothetical protein
MRPFNVKLMGCIGLLIVLAIITACGSSGDLLDETGTKYNAYVLPQDGYSDQTKYEVDVFSHLCDSGDYEGIYATYVKVVVEADTTDPDFYVRSYDVTLQANHGTYREANGADARGYTVEDLTESEMPDFAGTVLNPLHYTYSSPLITGGSTVELTQLLLWSHGDKDYYTGTVLNVAPYGDETVSDTVFSITYSEESTTDFVYDVQVVLHCVTVENVEFTITTPWTPFHFLDVDTCTG